MNCYLVGNLAINDVWSSAMLLSYYLILVCWYCHLSGLWHVRAGLIGSRQTCSFDRIPVRSHNPWGPSRYTLGVPWCCRKKMREVNIGCLVMEWDVVVRVVNGYKGFVTVVKYGKGYWSIRRGGVASGNVTWVRWFFYDGGRRISAIRQG